MDTMDTRTITEPSKDAELNRALKAHQVLESSEGAGFWLTVSLLWSCRHQLYRFAIWGFAIGLVVAVIIPPKFKSTTQLMPPDNESGAGMSMLSSFISDSGTGTGGSVGPDLGSIASGLLGLKTPGELFVGVLGSRTVQDDLINRFDLRKEYRVKRYESARKELKNNTELSLDRKSGIITITVYDRHPQQVAEMAKEYVSELNILLAQLSTSSARRERIFLEERLKVVKQELDSAAKDLAEYSSHNATLDVEDEAKALVEATATLQGELIAAQSEARGLEQIYTPNNVRVRSLHARIAELEQKLNQLGGSKGMSASDASEGNAQDGKESFLYPSLRQLPILGQRYLELYRDAKIDEKVYELLTAQYEMARVQEAKEIPTVKVLDVANIPERKSSPPRAALTILFTVFFVLVGCVWVLGNRRWQQLDAYSPLKLTVTEIVRDIRATKLWRRSEDFVHSCRARWVGSNLYRRLRRQNFPQE
jgi:uncharacterized protein involved in exopolysaccharide biosynthesis